MLKDGFIFSSLINNKNKKSPHSTKTSGDLGNCFSYIFYTGSCPMNISFY